MFLHLLKNRLKILARDRELMFWTFLFPIVLAILFNLAFSGLDDMDRYKDIRIAVVATSSYQEDITFQNSLKAVSEGKDKLFNLTILENEDKAQQEVKNGNMIGYIIDGTWKVKEEGMEQTIVKTFLEQYKQKESTIKNLITLNQGKFDPTMLEDLVSQTNHVKETTYSKENPDQTVNYFFTLIAMACLYAGFWGVKEIKDIQANQSSRAARINFAPVHKMKVILYNLVACSMIEFTSILVLLGFVIGVLNVNFGSQLGCVVLTSLLATIVGISMGMLVGVVCKKGETAKTGILIAVTMTGSFLAGMMYQNMKYIIQTYAPIVGYLNPVNLVTDAFYALYYYDGYERYLGNMGLLAIFLVVFLGITYYTIRRQKYEGI